LSWLLVKLLPDLLLEGDLSTDLLLLKLCNIVGLEWEVLLLEKTAPLWHHLMQAARGIRTRKDCSLSEALGLREHVEAAVDLGEHVIRLKGYVEFSQALCFGGELCQALLVAIARIEKKQRVNVVALLKALLS